MSGPLPGRSAPPVLRSAPGVPDAELRPSRPPTSRRAVAGLVVGVVWLAGLGSVVAVVLSAVALRDVRTGAVEGRGIAVAGIVVGVVGLVAGLVVWLVFGAWLLLLLLAARSGATTF